MFVTAVLFFSERSFIYLQFMLSAEQLAQIFYQCFYSRFRTITLGQFHEPIYIPVMHKDDERKSLFINEYHYIPKLEGLMSQHAIIGYRHNYAQSLLHEVAHWCVAGEERRLQIDYGYWYEPDGRNEQQQSEFYRVEILPQSIEWLFSKALCQPFQPSFDNLAMEIIDEHESKRRDDFRRHLLMSLNTLTDKVDCYLQRVKDTEDLTQNTSTLGRVACFYKALQQASNNN